MTLHADPRLILFFAVLLVVSLGIKWWWGVF